MDKHLCLSYMLAVGGESLLRDLQFNGCSGYVSLVSGGYLGVSGEKVFLTPAGWVALQRGLPRGSWWLVGRAVDRLGCPFVSLGGVVVAPFSWVLWESFSERFSEAYIVRGFRAGARAWRERYARRPYESLYRARGLLERAMEVYVAGGNRAYVEKVVEEAWRRIEYSCRVLGTECRRPRGGRLGGVIISLRRLVESLAGRRGPI